MQRRCCSSSSSGSSTRHCHRAVAVHATAASGSSGTSSMQQHTPPSRRRRATHHQQLDTAAEADASSSSRAADLPPAAPPPPPPPPPIPPAQLATRRQRGRPRKGELAAGSAAALAQSLIDATQLSRATAEALVASFSRYSGIPRDLGKLASRVQHLQQLLGPKHADLAVRRYPNLMGHSPETLALNYQQWQAFFAPDSADASTQSGGDGGSGSDGHAAAAAQQAMLRRLARSPQLLGVAVERQVGNLYEAGVMLDAQDLHEFAYKAMSLGRVQPQTLHEKLRNTLAFLNAVLQQAEQEQADVQQLQQLPLARPLQQQQQPATSSSSGGRQKQQQQARLQEAVSMADLQKSARRDHNWLTLNSDTLQQRLTDFKDQLQLSWPQTVRMFLQQPSVINKRPALMGQRAAALQALPGMGRERGEAVALAMPTVLQVNPAMVASRWRQLGEAAASHPGWAARFAAMSPTTIASLLIRSQARYDRLAEVVGLGHQDANSFVTVLAVSEDAYGAMLAKHQQQEQTQQAGKQQPQTQQ